MSLPKLPFLFSALITAHTLQTPPTARVPAANREKNVPWLEWYVSTAARFNCKAIKVASTASLFLKPLLIQCDLVRLGVDIRPAPH